MEVFSFHIYFARAEDLCQSFVVAAGAIENEAIDLDRRGAALPNALVTFGAKDARGAIEKYEESHLDSHAASECIKVIWYN